MRLVQDGKGNNFLTQDSVLLQPPSADLRKFIQANTGSTYTWSNLPAESTAIQQTWGRPFVRKGCVTAECAAGIGPNRQGQGPDYLSVQGNIYVASGGLTVNLHDGSIFWAAGAGRAYPAYSAIPGFSLAFGKIIGGTGALDTTDFLKGAGTQANAFYPVTPVIPIGIGGGLNHSYGGKTSLEIGIGTPGVGISPASYGNSIEKQVD